MRGGLARPPLCGAAMGGSPLISPLCGQLLPQRRSLSAAARQPAFRADPSPLWGYRVIAEFRKWLAAQKPPGGQKQTFDQAVGGQRLHGVLAAGGHKAAVMPEVWADIPLVAAQKFDEKACDHSAAGTAGAALSGRPALVKSLPSVLLSWVLFKRGVWPRATSIISYPPIFCDKCSARAARITRRARLRCTARPTFLVAVSPMRV